MSKSPLLFLLCFPFLAQSQSPEVAAQLPPATQAPPQGHYIPGSRSGIADTSMQVYGLVQSFQWKEDIDGERLLKEDGALIGIGMRARWDLGQRWDLDVRTEIYGGSVDYDGALQRADGTSIPYQDETDYFGSRSEALFMHPLNLPQSSVGISPFIGLGLNTWIRELAPGKSFGYDEGWSFIYLPVGLEFTGQLSPNATWFAQANVNIPLDASEDVSRSSDLEPDPQVGFNIEAGVESGRWSASLAYSEYSFDISPINRDGFVQPNSDASLFSLRIGMSF